MDQINSTRMHISGNNSQEELNDLDPVIDISRGNSNFLTNHQSQPLSVLGNDNQLHMHQKQKSGMSQQYMGNKYPKGKSLLTNSNIICHLDVKPDSRKGYKTNPNILDSHREEDIIIQQINQKAAQQNDSQFMGKRNQVMQQTAPINQTNKRTKANTINVDDLQGQNHNPAPQSATFGAGA